MFFQEKSMAPARKRRKSEDGALLMEALLAVVILSVSLTLIIQSLMTSRRASVYSRDYSIAGYLLESKMFELVQQRWIEAPFEEEGVFSEPYGDYQYRIEAVSLDAGKTDEQGLNEVKVEVSWPRGNKRRTFSVATYLMGKPPERATGFPN